MLSSHPALSRIAVARSSDGRTAAETHGDDPMGAVATVRPDSGRASASFAMGGSVARRLEPAFREAVRRRSVGLQYRIWSDAVETVLADASCYAVLDPWLGRFPAPRPDEDAAASAARRRASVSLLGALLCRNPYGQDAHAAARDVEADLHLWRDAALAALAANRVMQTYVWSGHLAEAGRFMRLVHARIEPRVDEPLAAAGLLATESMFHWFNGDARRADERVGEGLRLCDGSKDAWFDQLCINGAYAALVAGDARRAASYLSRTECESSQRSGPEACHRAMLQARVAMLDGDDDAALSWARDAVERVRALAVPTLESLCELNLCQVRLERGDSLSESEMRMLSDASVHPDSGLVRHLASLIGSVASAQHASSADHTAALSRKALRTVRQHGYRRLPWWSRELLRDLCEAAYDHGVETESAARLIRDQRLVTSRIDLDRWPRAVRIYTLGRFSLVCEHEGPRPGRKPHKRPVDLLKVIVALGGRNVGVQRICDVLWPEVEGDDARHSFETTLYRLRRLINCHEAIRLESDTVTLDHRYCWVDAWALERTMGSLDELLRRGGDEHIETAVRAQLDRVFGLYHGDFLRDEGVGPSAVSLRERLRSRFIRLLRAAGRYWEHSERWEDAVLCYEKALEVDDLVELFYQRLIVCHTQLGRPAEALNVYQRCRKVLATTLGVQPSAETLALGRRLIDG